MIALTWHCKFSYEPIICSYCIEVQNLMTHKAVERDEFSSLYVVFSLDFTYMQVALISILHHINSYVDSHNINNIQVYSHKCDLQSVWCMQTL